MKNRDISLIALGLLTGAIIGGVIGNLMGWMLPEGVVKDFFLTSFNLDIGSGFAGKENGVIVIDLKIITLKFGLALSLNFTSVIGLATSYYILRYFVSHFDAFVKNKLSCTARNVIYEVTGAYRFGNGFFIFFVFCRTHFSYV